MKVLVLKFCKNIFRYFFLLMLISTVTTYIRLTIKPRHYKEFNIWKVENGKSKAKFILKWSREHSELDCLKDMNEAFKQNNCEYDNCYVTEDKHLFGEDYTKFDAIIIDGRAVSAHKGYKLPEKRSNKQLYIFASRESSANYPICDKKFDGYFNLTWTYKLDSDIPWNYFYVYDHEQIIIGPKIDMKWLTVYEPAVGEYGLLVAEKEKAAIWIASTCLTKSRREMLVSNLKFGLKHKKLHVETVGRCGLTQCPIELEDDCLKLMYKYYFYFAFENSLSEDYVTDNILKAVHNYIVPVVFGDVNYTRFLPPHSYLDAGRLGTEATIKLMMELISDTAAYLDYFRWRNHYYLQRSNHFVCELCKLLNSDVNKVYKDFRNWWNPKKLKAYGKNVATNICKER